MTDPEVEVQIRELELQLLDPHVRRSREALARILADDFIEFGSSGRVFDRQQVFDGLSQEPDFQFTISDFRTHLLAPGSALATYRIEIRPKDQPARRSLRSSVWRSIHGRWLVVFHQGTPTEDDSRRGG